MFGMPWSLSTNAIAKLADYLDMQNACSPQGIFYLDLQLVPHPAPSAKCHMCVSFHLSGRRLVPHTLATCLEM